MILVIIRSYSSKNMNQMSLMKLPVAGLWILFGFAAIAQADTIEGGWTYLPVVEE